ncbi:MAG: hypothetical protein NC393_06180 [Clostridium sp.]|nr:hypothetical protein [Clostridium sp.]MCM1207412.1 hypothetical protein [Ruminococcus sp.]
MTDSEKLDLILTGVIDLNTRMYRVEEDLKEVKEEVKLLKDRMDNVERELKEVKEEVAILKEDLKEVKEEVAILKEDLKEVKEEVAILKEDLKEVKEEVAILKEDLKEVKEEVTKTSLIIENELRVNIQRIAEGHLDLSRNMHDVIRPNNEVEVLVVRVGVLETEVNYIKKNLHMNVVK